MLDSVRNFGNVYRNFVIPVFCHIRKFRKIQKNSPTLYFVFGGFGSDHLIFSDFRKIQKDSPTLYFVFGGFGSDHLIFSY